jgi:hypothetical protein
MSSRFPHPAILWMLVGSSLAAQAGPPQPGERIRVFSAGRPWEGVYVGADSAVLRYVPPGAGDTVAVPRRSVDGLEVQRGRRRATGRGAALGAPVGGLAGLVMGLATAEECGPNDFVCIPPWFVALSGAALGAAAGSGIGAIIGTLVTQDAWVAVDPRGLRLTATPPGLGISVVLSF